MAPFSFDLAHVDRGSAARRGAFHTPHGPVETPAFMPVGTQASVKGLSIDAVRIRPGQRVILDYWGGEKPLEGRVRVREPAAFTKISALGVEEQRVNIIIDLVSPPDERPTLGDGYRVNPSGGLRAANCRFVMKSPGIAVVGGERTLELRNCEFLASGPENNLVGWICPSQGHMLVTNCLLAGGGLKVHYRTPELSGVFVRVGVSSRARRSGA